MKKDWSIGLMTGTANDGNIDIAAIRTDGEKIIEFGPYELFPYENKKIRELVFETYEAAKTWNFQGPEPKIFSSVEKLITIEQSEAVNKFITKYNLQRESIFSIGFHGQTILHRPPNNIIKLGKTRQLGDGNMMSNYLKLPVAFDFRSNDVAHGGQGAPLAPIYHLALSKLINKNSLVFLNIGGISNITFIGENDNLIAFDAGPGNAPIDDFVKKNNRGSMDKNGEFAERGKANSELIETIMNNNRGPMDKNGEFAERGKANSELIETIMNNKYFEKLFPKSLDRFDFDFQDINQLEFEDGCATITKIISLSIAKGINQLPQKPLKIIVSGGGSKNLTLMKQLNTTTNISCAKVEDYGFRGDAIEAEAFAYLSARCFKNLPLSFPFTTGVKEPMLGGTKISP